MTITVCSRMDKINKATMVMYSLFFSLTIFNNFTKSVSIMWILCYPEHVCRIWDLYTVD